MICQGSIVIKYGNRTNVTQNTIKRKLHFDWNPYWKYLIDFFFIDAFIEAYWKYLPSDNCEVLRSGFDSSLSPEAYGQDYIGRNWRWVSMARRELNFKKYLILNVILSDRPLERRPWSKTNETNLCMYINLWIFEKSNLCYITTVNSL